MVNKGSRDKKKSKIKEVDESERLTKRSERVRKVEKGKEIGGNNKKKTRKKQINMTLKN